MGLEPTNLLTASQALYQLSYAPVAFSQVGAPAATAVRVCMSLPLGERTTLVRHAVFGATSLARPGGLTQ